MLVLTHTLVSQICLENSHWSLSSFRRFTLTYQRIWKHKLDRAHSSPHNLVFTEILITSPKILPVAFCVILIDPNQVNSFELFANTSFHLRSKGWIFFLKSTKGNTYNLDDLEGEFLDFFDVTVPCVVCCLYISHICNHNPQLGHLGHSLSAFFSEFDSHKLRELVSKFSHDKWSNKPAPFVGETGLCLGQCCRLISPKPLSHFPRTAPQQWWRLRVSQAVWRGPYLAGVSCTGQGSIEALQSLPVLSTQHQSRPTSMEHPSALCGEEGREAGCTEWTKP